MKKLLSLLSVLTISGTTIPTTIAASPYQKEEIIKNGDINYQQTNNLESLKRNKRDVNFLKTESVDINWNVRDYFKDLCSKVLKYLLRANVILSISDSNSSVSVNCDTNYYVINSNSNYNYFVVPFNVEDRGIIDLIFRSSDFYLQGFTWNTTFYHFSDSTINIIPEQNSVNLNFDSNYNSLVRGNPSISWTGITQAFNDLFNYGSDARYRNNTNIIQAALARIILATSESMRFREVRRLIQDDNNNYWTTNFYNIITNWSATTQNAINYLTENRNLNNFVGRNIILIFSSAMLRHLHSCNNKNTRSTEQNNLMCFNKIDNKTSDSKCTFGKYIVNHITWKNLIPGYGLFHVFTC